MYLRLDTIVAGFRQQSSLANYNRHAKALMTNNRNCLKALITYYQLYILHNDAEWQFVSSMTNKPPLDCSALR